MKEQICYPYAYGRLSSSLDSLTNMLQWECMMRDVEIDDKVIDMLQEMIKQLQEKALVESYSHS